MSRTNTAGKKDRASGNGKRTSNAREALAAQWESLAAEAFSGVKEWRLQHPKATFAEIEAAVDERLSLVRARMLEDVALASAAAMVTDTPLVARPACPVCATGTPQATQATQGRQRGPTRGRLESRGHLEAWGQHTREVTVTYGRTVTLRRE